MSGAAHAVHYAIVIIGILGTAFLLLPAYAGPRAPRTSEEQRIADLRYTVEAGLLGTGALLTRPVVRRFAAARSGTVLPVAVIASAAAAGVHAAVGPAHLAEGVLIGSFFVLSSTFQLVWAAAVLRRSSPSLLFLGVVANAAFVVLWGVTRTIGLGFVGVEPVGPWDLAAVVWETVVVLSCLYERQHVSGQGRAVAPVAQWSTTARWCLALSVVALGVLSVWGAGA